MKNLVFEIFTMFNTLRFPEICKNSVVYVIYIMYI